jgi:type IV pilus assembly protein PilM
LANTKDINSTEKLLNVIRGEESPASAPLDGDPNFASKQNDSGKNMGGKGFFAAKKRIKIGVDIGHNVISLTKMTNVTEGKPALLGQKNVLLGEKITRGTPEFNNLLLSSINVFAGSLKDCEVWAMMTAADVNVNHLKIPRVPKNQLSNVIYWTAKKENPIDEKEMIFDYEMQGEITDNGVPKYSVMVYNAPRAEVEKIQDMFSAIGIELDGITIAPFAIQNIFRTNWISAREKTFATIFIGNNFSRIDIYSKNNLMMTRGIKTGINSMREAVDEVMGEISFDREVNKEGIEKLLKEFADDPGKWLLKKDSINWSEYGVLDIIQPAMERLVRQIERTLEYYSDTPGNERVEKLYLSSVVNVFYHPLLQYIGEQIATKMELFDPFQGKDAAKMGASMSVDERAAMAPAMGLALSDIKHTPNFIYTYVQKQREETARKINYGIFAAFAVCLLICVGIMVYEGIKSSSMTAQRTALEKELSQFQPLLSKDKIIALANELKLRQETNKQYSKKYRGSAFIGELSFLTPEKIRLISLQVGGVPAGGDAAKKDATKTQTSAKDEDDVSIEGVVLGETAELDDLLAQYIMKLENSPMIQSVTLQKSSKASYRKKEILQFTINAKIG